MVRLFHIQFNVNYKSATQKRLHKTKLEQIDVRQFANFYVDRTSLELDMHNLFANPADESRRKSRSAFLPSSSSPVLLARPETSHKHSNVKHVPKSFNSYFCAHFKAQCKKKLKHNSNEQN